MNHFIFFHGVGIRSPFWNTITPLLEQESIEYSLVDLDFSSLDNAFQSSTDAVKKLMNQYPDRDIVLVGHSLGGLFAAYVAQHYGEAIHKLIIVNTGLAPVHVSVKTMQQMQINFLSKFFKKIGMRLLFRGQLPKWLTGSLFFTEHTSKEVKIELSKNKIREKRSFLMEHFNSKKIWNKHFKRIHFSGPDNVLTIFGNKDKTTPIRAFMNLKKIFNASHIIYDGCGHNDVITAEKFNKKFVKDIKLFSNNV